jgi:hypothetical protein
MAMHLARLSSVALTLALLAGLSACGGGGDSSTSSSVDVSSRSSAQSVGASGAAMPADSTEAAGVAVATAQAALAVAGNCAGGGAATFSITGGTTLSRANGVFDAGEVYDITFAQCKSASGAAVVNGRMALTVLGTAPSLSVSTGTVNLSVALPLRTVTLNGSSTLTQTIATSGASTTTTTTHWVSPGIRVDSLRSTGGSTHYELSNVDYTRAIVAVNGVPVSSSCDGHSTLDARLLFFPWFITLATVGPINYGPTGIVISGHWTIDLPRDHIDLQISASSVSLRVDLGNNGSDDLVFIFSLTDFFTAAG